MAVRTTIDLPEALHEVLQQRARKFGSSVDDLIVSAIEQTLRNPLPATLTKRIDGPLMIGTGKVGPRFPRDETPYDLILP